jgi:hypothetical protein
MGVGGDDFHDSAGCSGSSESQGLPVSTKILRADK